MERLTAFAKKWSRNVPGLVGCWLGDISGVRVSKRALEIARRAGFDPPPDCSFPEISDVTASRVLSYGLHQSIAYGQRTYRESASRDMLMMLRELGPSAQFWADNAHTDFADGVPSIGHRGNARLTNATFEVGVIAANDTTGFIWWRAEED
jgi:hypothetical protein